MITEKSFENKKYHDIEVNNEDKSYENKDSKQLYQANIRN